MAATAALAASRSKRSGSESSPAHAPISSRAWPGGPASISLRSANPPVPPESSGGQAPRSKELLPRRAGAAGRGADSGGVQDLPHSGGDDRVAGLDQFALYAPVPPRWVVRSDADHELADRGCRRRPAGGLSAGVVPFSCDQPPVPGEQRRRGNREHVAPLSARDQPRQCREPQPVARLRSEERRVGKE